MAASGIFAVITGASLLPVAFAVVMSAAPKRRPRSEGLIGVASTRTTTSSAAGSGVVTFWREISSSPLFLISERSCRPDLPSVLITSSHCCVWFDERCFRCNFETQILPAFLVQTYAAPLSKRFQGGLAGKFRLTTQLLLNA